MLVVMRIQSNGRFGLVPPLSSIHETLMGLILAWGEENGFEGRSGRNVRAGQASETCIQDRAQSALSSSADMGLTCCDSVCVSRISKPSFISYPVGIIKTPILHPVLS